jgi:hypothetical protein
MIKRHPGVLIELDDNPRFFLPGQAISGRYRLDPSYRIPKVQALEWSIAWSTEGKGDEDHGVHAIQTIHSPNGGMRQPDSWRRFEAILPPSPLSYDGLIVKVIWRVRVRAVFGRKDEWVGDLPFGLGNVDRLPDPDDDRP